MTGFESSFSTSSSAPPYCSITIAFIYNTLLLISFNIYCHFVMKVCMLLNNQTLLNIKVRQKLMLFYTHFYNPSKKLQSKCHHKDSIMLEYRSLIERYHLFFTKLCTVMVTSPTNSKGFASLNEYIV